MLILVNATDSIEAVLSGAPVTQLPIVAMYRDIDADEYLPGRNLTLTNGVTAVQAVSGPALNYQRVIDFLSVYNPNVANATITVRYDANGTEFNLATVTLAQNERLEYQEGRGFAVFTAAGAMKNSLNQGTNSVASGDSVAVLGADVINNNAVANTIADITGLQFPVVAGLRYWFEFFIRYTSAATTTGARFSVSGPTVTELTYASRVSLTGTSDTVNEGLAAYDLPAASNVSSANIAGNIALIRGIVLPSANGNVIARFASEIASSAITAKTGSFVRYRQL